MPTPRVYVEEVCPLDGYADLRVRVLANATDGKWRAWATSTLGTPDCESCQKLTAPPRRGKRAALTPEPAARRYCPACTAARQQYGQSIALFYGPSLLGEDVSTPEAALTLFDRDDALPSEIVIWLQLLPSAIRNARVESLMGNLTRSSTTPS